MEPNAPADAASPAPLAPTGSRPVRRPRSVWLLLAAGGVTLTGLALAAPQLGWRWSTPTVAIIEAQLAAKQFRPAARDAQALLRESPNDPRLLYDLARAHAGLGESDRAVEALDRIPAWSLRKPESLFYEGKIRLAQRRGRDAERAFRACVATGVPSADNARLELLAILAMEERFEAFKQVFWEVYPRLGEGDRLPVLTMRMRMEFEQVKPELNAETLRGYLEADPGDTDARAGLAAALDHSGDQAGALGMYAQALAERPDDLPLRERYLDLLTRAGESATLRTVLAGRPAGSDDRAAIQRHLGILAQTDNQLPAAEAAFRRSIAADPSVSETHHRLSQVLQRLGRRDEAAQAAAERDRINQARDTLRKAWNDLADTFENRPDELTPDLLFGMARACGECGLTREAEAWTALGRQLASAATAGPAPGR